MNAGKERKLEKRKKDHLFSIFLLFLLFLVNEIRGGKRPPIAA
jgi:hypothetical protein